MDSVNTDENINKDYKSAKADRIKSDDKSIYSLPPHIQRELSRPLPDISFINKDRFKNSKLLKISKSKKEQQKRLKEQITQIQKMKEKAATKCYCDRGVPQDEEYYLNVIQNSALSVPIPLMPDKWVDKVKKNISEHLIKNLLLKQSLEEEMKEFKEEYENGMKKAIVENVIKIKEEEPKYVTRSFVKVEESWKKRHLNASKQLQKKLHRISPITCKILEISNKYLSSKVMLDFTEPSFLEPLTIVELHTAVRNECDKTDLLLQDEWFQDIIAVFLDKSNLNKYSDDMKKILCNSCNTLIGIQGRNVIERTMRRYISLFQWRVRSREYSKPIIKVSLSIGDNVISSSPTVGDLEKAFLTILEIVTN